MKPDVVYSDGRIRIVIQKKVDVGERRIESTEDESVLCICDGTMSRVTSCFVDASALKDEDKKEEFAATANIQIYCSRLAIHELNMQITGSEDDNDHLDSCDEQ